MSNTKNGTTIENKSEFVQFCLLNKVLKFGDFTLKSGIKSQYFFNLGEINEASQLERLSSYYSKLITDLYREDEYDVIFGAAYKGIPICVSISLFLLANFNINKPFSFNRKEMKHHGCDSNSSIVGKSVSNLRVLIVDDVFTKGTAIQESIELLKSYNAKIVGCVVALDRMEPNLENNKQTTKQLIESRNNVKVHSIINLDDVIKFLELNHDTKENTHYQKVLNSMLEARKQ